jgi:SAM-dependent methyltransferase
MSTANTKTTVSDSWKSAQSYDDYMGRWSRLVAPRFLDWLGAPPRKSWLEIGCGTGALTQAILARCAPKRVLAIDLSPDFIAHAKAKTVDSRVEFANIALENVRGEKFDFIVSGLVLNFLPRPYDGLSLMKQIANDGGVIAAYVWDYADGMQFLRYFWDAVIGLDDSAAALDEAKRFPVCRPEALRGLFEGAKLNEIAVEAIEVPTEFASFEDYWRPFEGGQGPAPSHVATLEPQKRAALKKQLSETLPTDKNGFIRLTARTWAVRGSK